MPCSNSKIGQKISDLLSHWKPPMSCSRKKYTCIKHVKSRAITVHDCLYHMVRVVHMQFAAVFHLRWGTCQTCAMDFLLLYYCMKKYLFGFSDLFVVNETFLSTRDWSRVEAWYSTAEMRWVMVSKMSWEYHRAVVSRTKYCMCGTYVSFLGNTAALSLEMKFMFIGRRHNMIYIHVDYCRLTVVLWISDCKVNFCNSALIQLLLHSIKYQIRDGY